MDFLVDETVLTLVAINVIAAVGMNLVYITGQLNLGQAAFFAVGAYSVGVLEVEFGWPLAPALVAGAVVAGIVAVPVAVGANRVRGIYLIMGTLAFGELARVVIGNIDYVGGRQGYIVQQRVSTMAIFVTLGVVLALATALMASPLGLRMRSVFDDEDAAAAAGVATRRVKVFSVVVSAGVVAVAGGLLAKWLSFFAPRDFDIGLSFEIALFTLIGGVHSLVGAVVGATGISLLLEFLKETPELGFVPSAFHFLSNWREVVFGVLILVLMAVRPEGFVSRSAGLRLTSSMRRLRRRIARPSPDSAPVGESPPGVDVPVIEINEVTHHFGGVQALDSVDLVVDRGEIVALIGANGAGKTTLIDVVSGRIPGQTGNVVLDGVSIAGMRPEQRTRRGVGRTFQDLRVFAHLTVEETVRLGAQISRPGGMTVEVVLGLIGLDDRPDALPARLTLAERRRLEIGRVVAANPKVLFLDEPSVGLNDTERDELADLIREIRDTGVAIVVVDHNLDVALGTADRVVVLDFGEVIARGTPTQILADPKVREAYLGAADRTFELGEATP